MKQLPKHIATKNVKRTKVVFLRISTFRHFLQHKFSAKTKDAPTVVSAPKNADSNCRQTNFKIKLGQILYVQNPKEAAFLLNSYRFCTKKQKGIIPP